MEIYFVFIFGLIVGSFLNVVILRGAKNQKLLGRSYCDNCGKILTWYELVPVLSFLIQGGNCRFCKKKISIQYPLVELATGLLLAGVFYKIGSLNVSLIYYFIAICFWIILFVCDLKYYAIPDRIIFPAVGISLLYSVFLFFFKIQNFQNIIYSVLIGAGLFFILVVVSKERWMGWGDVLLGVFLGLFLNTWRYALLALILSFIIGGIFAIILMLLKQKKFGDQLPFGPFLITGALIVFFWGEIIINWYLNLFN